MSPVWPTLTDPETGSRLSTGHVGLILSSALDIFGGQGVRYEVP